MGPMANGRMKHFSWMQNELREGSLRNDLLVDQPLFNIAKKNHQNFHLFRPQLLLQKSKKRLLVTDLQLCLFLFHSMHERKNSLQLKGFCHSNSFDIAKLSHTCTTQML